MNLNTLIYFLYLPHEQSVMLHPFSVLVQTVTHVKRCGTELSCCCNCMSKCLYCWVEKVLKQHITMLFDILWKTEETKTTYILHSQKVSLLDKNG